MHGQRREEYKARLRDPTTATKLAHKAHQWHSLSQTLLQQRSTNTTGVETLNTPQRDMEALKLTEKLLYVNPDPLYLWNNRREHLLKTFSASVPLTFWEEEQILTQTALQRNPKAYGAWFHRKWALRHYLCHGVRFEEELCLELLKTELCLCKDFLMLDERNFHCWNYRRFIVGLMMDRLTFTEDITPAMDGSWALDHLLCQNSGQTIGAQIAVDTISRGKRGSGPTNHAQAQEVLKLLLSEWDFTTEKIEQNFSNGSAFHYRSKLLPLLTKLDEYCNGGNESSTRAKFLNKEFDLLRNAIFTEPDDQTPWWYFRFILSWANPKSLDECTETEMKEYQDLLYDEWSSIQELVESENGACKWGLLGLHMLASEFNRFGETYKNEQQDWKHLATDYLMQLQALDPDRCCRYKSMLQ